jgi:plastocyanin
MKQALPAVVALLSAACGTQAPPPKTVEATKVASNPVEYFHVDPATAGTVSGKIAFHGAKPARKLISMDSEAGCEQAHKGRPVYNEPVVTGKNGALLNAFVYIQAGLEGKKFEPAKQAVALDQRGCLFVPRVIGLQTGETLSLKNSDTVSHNVHPMPQNNREWNQQQSPGTPDVEHRFPRAEVMIPVKCNVHAWMHAYIGVVEHPYFAVTGADGAFELKNVPPGDYTVAVWHEKLGQQTQQVHVAPSTAAAVNFTYP